MWDRILPRENDELKLAYMNVLMQEGQANAAFQVWNRIAGGPSRFSFSAARPFLDELINRRLFVEAETVWLDLQKHGIVSLAGSDDRNGIFNGDFERFPLNAGFDWRYLEGPYVSLDFGATPAYRGSRCLRLEFTVSRNEEFEPVYQFVPVVPNRSYLLSAYVRSEGITSDSGPRLRVTDPACGGCLDASDDGTGALNTIDSARDIMWLCRHGEAAKPDWANPVDSRPSLD